LLGTRQQSGSTPLAAHGTAPGAYLVRFATSRDRTTPAVLCLGSTESSSEHLEGGAVGVGAHRNGRADGTAGIGGEGPGLSSVTHTSGLL
jgi:hypothetical protein